MKLGTFIWAIIIIVLFLVGGTFIGMMQLRTQRIYVDGSNFGKGAILFILANPDKKEIIDRSSPEFLQAVSQEELDKLSVTLRRLGKLKKFDGYITGYDISDTKKGERVVYASYEAQTEFDSGPAKFTLGLIRHDVTWQIISFKVESKALSK